MKHDFNFSRYGIDVRLVDVIDAKFICKLRNDKFLNKYLNHVDTSIEEQENWIKRYKKRESLGEEYYFVFSKNGVDLGLERIYNIVASSYTFGSLIFDINAPLGASILSDIITKEIGFGDLGLNTAYFEVRKGNIDVIKYHQNYEPILVGEDSQSLFYCLETSKFEKSKKK
jgi:hypothetical protein